MQDYLRVEYDSDECGWQIIWAPEDEEDERVVPGGGLNAGTLCSSSDLALDADRDAWELAEVFFAIQAFCVKNLVLRKDYETSIYGYWFAYEETAERVLVEAKNALEKARKDRGPKRKWAAELEKHPEETRRDNLLTAMHGCLVSAIVISADLGISETDLDHEFETHKIKLLRKEA